MELEQLIAKTTWDAEKWQRVYEDETYSFDMRSWAKEQELYCLAILKALKELSKLREKPKTEKPKTEKYSEFTDLYFDFYQKRIGVKPKFTGVDGKAIKEIAKYLDEVSVNNDGLIAWEYILNNWSKLTPFIGNQISTLQINKNINEILSQLRNGTTKSEQHSNNKQQDARAVFDAL